MGLFQGWLNSDNKSVKYIDAPIPKVDKFTILKTAKVNKLWIAEIKYDGCTTFSGRKLLIMNTDPYNLSSIDPHLLSESHCVIARFQPNKKGWDLAKMCCQNYK